MVGLYIHEIDETLAVDSKTRLEVILDQSKRL